MSSTQAQRLALALVLVVAALAQLPEPLLADKALIKDFKDLHSIASRLESAEMNPPSRSAELDSERKQLLYMFARDNKSDRCNAFQQTSEKIADEFKIKAYMYADEQRKRTNNWFNTIITFGGPLGAMKNLAKSDNFLHSVAEKYERKSKSKQQFSHQDVDCDVDKFRIRRLFAILFVLQTDIKYLVTEDAQVQNKAIFEALKADKFVSSSNFYEIAQPTSRQRKLLLKYFADRVDTSARRFGEALDHCFNPGEFVLGRLLDTCQTFGHFVDELTAAEDSYGGSCANSAQDPSEELFAKQYPRGKYADTANFCGAFLDAL